MSSKLRRPRTVFTHGRFTSRLRMLMFVLLQKVIVKNIVTLILFTFLRHYLQCRQWTGSLSTFERCWFRGQRRWGRCRRSLPCGPSPGLCCMDGCLGKFSWKQFQIDFVPRKCLEEKQSNASREGANSKRIGSFVIVLSAQVTSGKRAKIQWCWSTSLFRPHIAFSVWNRTDDSQQLQDVSELLLCRYQPALWVWAPDWVFILDKREAL